MIKASISLINSTILWSSLSLIHWYIVLSSKNWHILELLLVDIYSSEVHNFISLLIIFCPWSCCGHCFLKYGSVSHFFEERMIKNNHKWHDDDRDKKTMIIFNFPRSQFLSPNYCNIMRIITKYLGKQNVCESKFTKQDWNGSSSKLIVLGP